MRLAGNALCTGLMVAAMGSGSGFACSQDAGSSDVDGGGLSRPDGASPSDGSRADAAGDGMTGSLEAPTGPAFYVAPSGSDDNPGTLAAPFQTITRGVRALTPGATLYVRGGAYAESLQWDSSASANWPAGTSWSAPVTVAGYGGEVATLRPPAGASFGIIFTGSTTQYVVIKDLVIDSFNAVYDAVKITNASATGSASHIRIEGCEIEHAYGQGILLTDGADGNEMIGLNIHDCGSTANTALPPHSMTPVHYHGIYCSTSNNLIERSELHHNPGYGVHVYNGDGSANANVVRRNSAHDNGMWAQWGGGIIIGSGDDNVAYDNLSFDNGGYGIEISYTGVAPSTGNNNRALNNTIYHNGKYGLELGYGVQNTVLRNNIVYASNWAGLDDGGAGTIFDHNVAVDPKFVDAANQDFRLQPGSPAIDSGLALPEVAIDYAGVTRPLGAAYDVGAYESY